MKDDICIKEFNLLVMKRLHEFEDHWEMMGKRDANLYPEYQSFEVWFDRILEYVSMNVNPH